MGQEPDHSEAPQGAPSPQSAAVSNLFLQTARAFYDAYEDAQERTTGEARDLDKATLFEAWVFCLFVVDFSLHHSNQSDSANDCLFTLCREVILHAYTDYQDTHFGDAPHLCDTIQHRLERYAVFLNSAESQNLSEFASWHSPLLRQLEGVRGASRADPVNAPVVVNDAFQRLELTTGFSRAFLDHIGTFQGALRRLFDRNTDYRDLSEAEVYGRLDLNVEGDTRKKQIFRNPWDFVVIALIIGAMGAFASAVGQARGFGLDVIICCLVFWAYKKVTSGASSK